MKKTAVISDEESYFSDLALQVNSEKNHAQIIHHGWTYKAPLTRAEAAVLDLLGDEDGKSVGRSKEKQNT